ncbi:MAG TPA: GspE/PulE family protein [Phycisphaerae bacterium]|nr:GspE/PulE family protein [Phycisphaerae bacterium]
MAQTGSNSTRQKDGPVQPPVDEEVAFATVWSPDEVSDVPRGPGAVLLESGQITMDQYEAARKRQQDDPHMSVLDALVEAKAVSETAVLQAVASYFKVPFMSITSEDVEAATFELLDQVFIHRRHVIPIRREGEHVIVGVSDPADLFLVEEVRRRIRRPVQIVLTPAQDIENVLEKLGGSPLDDVEEIIEGINEDDVEVVDSASEEVTDLEKIAGESPVIRYVNFLIARAVQEGASDIHIEPGEGSLRIRYRIDGILFKQPAPPYQMTAAIISRLKIMANIDIAERRLPQDGRIRAMVHGRHVDLRVSTLPITHGEKCVIRILDNRSIMIGLDNLGMDPETLAGFARQIKEPHGIVLVTGPTGSGKTTTLYSALRTMDGDSLNISTVEDPVEYELSYANQVLVREGIGMTFAAALRSLLRQDPDVIMVGEIRDEETARIAVQASLTGHLVLSTLHTNDAPSSITRLINIGIEPYLIAASVNAVIAQRLVRRVCPHCKQPVETLREGIAQYLQRHGVQIERVYQGAGCEKCRQTGYSGRVGLYELVTLDDDIRDVVTSNPSLMELRRMCRDRGMRTLQTDGLAKVAQGLTSVEEVAKATEAF